jgi:lysozyme
MNENLHISQNGINLIKRWEGCILKIYNDIVQVRTIGYGHALSKSEITSGVFNNGITQEQADDLLINDVKRFEDAIKKYITVDLNQNQADALLSLCFNCGSGVLTGGLGKKLNAGDYLGAADFMLLWCKAAGKQNEGLLNRRKSERALFIKPIEDTDPINEQQVLNMVYETNNMIIDDLFEIDRDQKD